MKVSNCFSDIENHSLMARPPRRAVSSMAAKLSGSRPMKKKKIQELGKVLNQMQAL